MRTFHDHAHAPVLLFPPPPPHTHDGVLLMASPAAGLTVFEAAVVLTKLSLGTGCLSLPFVFAQLGPAPATALLLVVAAWNELGASRLLAAAAAEEVPGRPLAPQLSAVVRAALGRGLAHLSDAVMATVFLGVLVNYLLVAADMLAAVLGRPDAAVACTAACAAAGVALVLGVGASSRLLAQASTLSLLSLLAALAAAGLDAAGPPGDGARGPGPAQPFPGAVSAARLGQAFGICVYGFSTTPILLPVAGRMADPGAVARANRYSLAATTAFYVAVGAGVGGLLARRDGAAAVKPDCLLNLRTGGLTAAVRALLLVASLLTVPLVTAAFADIVMPLVAACGASSGGYSDDDGDTTGERTPLAAKAGAAPDALDGLAASPCRDVARAATRAGVVVVAALVAVATPDLATGIGIIGAGGCSLAAFVLPPLCACVLLRGRRRGVGDAALAVAGQAVSLYALRSAVAAAGQ